MTAKEEHHPSICFFLAFLCPFGAVFLIVGVFGIIHGVFPNTALLKATSGVLMLESR